MLVEGKNGKCKTASSDSGYRVHGRDRRSWCATRYPVVLPDSVRLEVDITQVGGLHKGSVWLGFGARGDTWYAISLLPFSRWQLLRYGPGEERHVVVPPRRGRFINAPERGNRIAVELRQREIRLFAGTIEVERYTVTNFLAGEVVLGTDGEATGIFRGLRATGLD